jgi:hypothetical protein
MMIRLTMPVLCALMLAPAASAQPAIPAGHWEGAVEAPDGNLKIEIDLARDPAGQVAGTINVPDQNLRGLTLANFERDKNSLAFQIKGTKGERLFTGDLSGDGQSISGAFTQRGMSMPFHLARTSDSRLAPRPMIPAIAKELAGKWTSTLEANGQQNELILTLSNRTDGSSEGAVLNSVEGLELPISNIAQEHAKVTLAIDAVGGSFSGVLNEAGTEIDGTWTQGASALPLTFHRAR